MESSAFIQQLDNYLKEQAQQSQGVQAGNKHVFQACMEHLQDQLDFDDKMVLMDYHMCYSNALDGARNGNLDASQHWLEKAESLPDFEQPILQRIVEINKVPAIAYHKYREGAYEKAIELLQKTIQTSGTLATQDGIDYLVWGQMEDYINIFRVYCTAKDHNKALQCAQSILLAVVHGQLTKGHVENVSPALLRAGTIDFISYATSDVLVRLSKLGILEGKALIKAVLEPVWSVQNWSSCPLLGYQHAMAALKYWSEDNIQDMLRACVDLLPFMNKQSPILQFFLLEALLPILEESLSTMEFEQMRIKMQQHMQQIGVDYYLLQHHSKLPFQFQAASYN